MILLDVLGLLLQPRPEFGSELDIERLRMRLAQSRPRNEILESHQASLHGVENRERTFSFASRASGEAAA